ncbi:MAG: ATP-binding protein [Treponema sp.]|nr:ATP-binding protein [Treponema sp.]
MYTINEINSDSLLAILFFLACGGYLFKSIQTIASDIKSKIHQEYVAAVSCVVLSCLFYGFMTIAENEATLRLFWAFGFISYSMFLPLWIRFSSNMFTIKHKLTKIIARQILIIISLIFSVAYILSDNTVFINTRYGNQFSFYDSLFFKVFVVYIFFLCICVFISHIRWWQESKMKRQRRQQLTFLILTFLFAPLGFITDFIIPGFTPYTITPLVSILLFPPSLQLYISMRINRTFSITVPNTSNYIFKSVTTPVLVLEYENTIKLENKAAHDFFGKTTLGQNVTEVIFSDKDAQNIPCFEKDITSRNIIIKTFNGNRICDMFVSIERDKYGDALCKVVVLRDITEKESFIQKLSKTSEELESALTQANIADKAKSDFLSNMSHEMRTPMNAIIGMTAIGRMAENIENKNHALNKIGDASSHLLSVINDILDMAKIEAGKLELAADKYNFEKMLQKVLAVVNFRAEEKDQTLTINIDKNIPDFIMGDEHRMIQVITNLMSNAVKFTPNEGNIQLIASLVNTNESFQEPGKNCELRVEVIDNGIGIPAPQQEKLFLAFEQATRNYGGTGLGLAICKRIVELMGGNIWVESELGKGAKFTFTAKAQFCDDDSLTDKQLNDSLEKLTADKKSSTDTDKFKGKKLLIVDDIEINREILIMLLEGAGFIIDSAENGQEALDMVAASHDKYDIVFMDMQMPFMNGLEATRRIRALPEDKNRKLPIIAMTANVFKDDIEACLEAGMNSHLSKPLDIDKVLSILHKYL